MQWAHSKAEKRISNAITTSTELSEWISGGLSSAGTAVTEKTAMRVSAVYACVALIGGAIASLPLPVMQRSGDERKKVDHALTSILNDRPNNDYPAAVFWESIIGSLLLHGDGYAEIMRPPRNSPNVLGLRWLPKRMVTVEKAAGQIIYIITDDNKKRGVQSADMIHIPGPGFDGLNGMSQISYVLKNPAGIAIAADEYSGAFFKNGARPDFAIEIPGSITEEQQVMMRKSWGDRFGGLHNKHLPALLTGGVKVHELTMNAEDAQLLNTRQFQVEDIARVFGVPPHMIGHTQNNTSWGSGVEQMSIGFVKYTLNRHLTKIEQELNSKLLKDKRYFVEFSTAGLERGDYKTRMEGYRIALGRAGEAPWMSVDEIRKIENLSGKLEVQTHEQTNAAASAE